MCKVWVKGKLVQCRGGSDFLQHGNLRTGEVEGRSDHPLAELQENRAEAESHFFLVRVEPFFALLEAPCLPQQAALCLHVDERKLKHVLSGSEEASA